MDGSLTAARFNTPVYMAIDGGNNLYVSDRSNCAIRQVSTTTSTVKTVAGQGSCSVVDGSSSVAQFNQANGIMYLSNGVLLVDDNTNSIREIGKKV